VKRVKKQAHIWLRRIALGWEMRKSTRGKMMLIKSYKSILREPR